jgi:hypothetical protein
MAQNDIIVPKEGAGGVLSEIALAASDLKLGTTANLPLLTGTNGVIEAGSFGTAAGSFCAGDDARLSDARTPSSTLAHKTSHATGGTDALAPSDIGAQSLFASSSEVLEADITLSASRAQRVNLENYDGVTYNVTLPTTDVRVGDVFIFTTGTLIGSQIIRRLNFGSNFTTLATISQGQSYRIISTGITSGSWQIDPVFTHTHAAADVTSGTLDVARLPVGTGSTQVAAGNHTHVVADVTGAAASGSITTSGLTQATARILGRTTASTGAVEEIQIGSGLSLSAGELSATGGSGGGEVRSDFVSPYTYTGLADAGTSESTASWTIRRSEFDAGGSFVATLTASAVEWDDRLTASYA